MGIASTARTDNRRIDARSSEASHVDVFHRDRCRVERARNDPAQVAHRID
jgi:hypothetical protein